MPLPTKQESIFRNIKDSAGSDSPSVPVKKLKKYDSTNATGINEPRRPRDLFVMHQNGSMAKANTLIPKP